jgi:hypothetical protein
MIGNDYGVHKTTTEGVYLSYSLLSRKVCTRPAFWLLSKVLAAAATLPGIERQPPAHESK